MKRAQWALQLACAQVFPNVTGQIVVGVDTATDDTYAVLGVSVPLPIHNRNQGNIRTTRANIAAASADIDKAQLSLASRLADAAGRYRVAPERDARLIEFVLPSAAETFELPQAAFKAGETDFIQLLTAQRTLFDTKLSIVEAAGVARAAGAEIEGLLVKTN